MGKDDMGQRGSAVTPPKVLAVAGYDETLAASLAWGLTTYLRLHT